MQDKHQWMSHTLFDMAAFCDRNGMDRQRDVLLDAVAALSNAWSDPHSTVCLGVDSQNLGKASLHGQLAA
jgi:hypothetical protein